MEFDFSGWATRNNVKCSDDRVIMRDAFKHNDGMRVPLVWNHQHNVPENILGHAMLENRNEGVYAYCKFNGTEEGQRTKALVEHGDIVALSIYANQLKQRGNSVVHGTIREVSLVLAGANPEATIDNIIAHGEFDEEAAEITFIEPLAIAHSDDAKVKNTTNEDEDIDDEEDTDDSILSTMNEKQQTLLYAMVGKALEEGKKEEKYQKEGDSEDMSHNAFERQNTNQSDELMHADIIQNAVKDAKRLGSMRESFIAHAEANNIDNIDYLFPDPKALNLPPEFIKENDEWVNKVMGAVKRSPFSRVKTLFAQMDETEARARGYIKGKEKANIKLAVLKRTTTPTTIYVKMKIDRDDVIDITDFDVVAWQKAEMKALLDKEAALAMLLGDGRDVSSDDKINEQNIRPVITDNDLFTIKYTVTDGKDFHNDFNSASENDSEAKGIIRAAIKARKKYKGSGNPTFFTTEDTLTELLLIEDQNGRRIYNTINDLALAMRVKEIVTVTEMEAHTDIYGVIVNMNDYGVGADKGGKTSMFDDFDIDYNQMKYLMEGRFSGALIRPYSAIVLKKASDSNTPGGSE